MVFYFSRSISCKIEVITISKIEVNPENHIATLSAAIINRTNQSLTLFLSNRELALGGGVVEMRIADRAMVSQQKLGQ